MFNTELEAFESMVERSYGWERENRPVYNPETDSMVDGVVFTKSIDYDEISFTFSSEGRFLGM